MGIEERDPKWPHCPPQTTVMELVFTAGRAQNFLICSSFPLHPKSSLCFSKSPLKTLRTKLALNSKLSLRPTNPPGERP
ncbi:hypothetical protein COLO4_07800 [Corchorus olitorius]|uniref:Uncharacterized protein n=1 Tax=Corchorus olitorius TaxID=93759 RepID=A0A1R3KII8_9ROSI|nr:hypothetical protein COLO4_07800 [Corchorus olitorius]